ncbi:MAG: DRTGG domain-containing protein [Chloroflexota bacterium]|nr:DRTGG domain-containing protein [Chloroflexota bacterium]
MGVLYIAGTGPGCGKTALVAGLALTLRGQGQAPIALKPLASPQDADNAFYRRLLPDMPEMKGLPAPLSAEGAMPRHVAESLGILVRSGRPLLLEGLDGLDPASPVGRASARLAVEASARVVLIARYHPALKGEELVSARALFGERLIGVVVNGVWRYQGHTARARIAPSLERAGLRVLGLVPEDRKMTAPTVAEVARCVDGEIRLYPEKGEERVEAIMVGGWPLDEGEYVFSRWGHKAVVVRADRPDLHMAALATSTTCLVLTGGMEPVQYTVYQAEQAGVPLVWTRLPTLEALERLEGVAQMATVRVPAKAQHYADLLARHTDLGALLRTLTG